MGQNGPEFKDSFIVGLAICGVLFVISVIAYCIVDGGYVLPSIALVAVIAVNQFSNRVKTKPKK